MTAAQEHIPASREGEWLATMLKADGDSYVLPFSNVAAAEAKGHTFVRAFRRPQPMSLPDAAKYSGINVYA